MKLEQDVEWPRVDTHTNEGWACKHSVEHKGVTSHVLRLVVKKGALEFL